MIKTYGRDPHISLILQMKKLRLREVKERAQGHTAW